MRHLATIMGATLIACSRHPTIGPQSVPVHGAAAIAQVHSSSASTQATSYVAPDLPNTLPCSVAERPGKVSWKSQNVLWATPADSPKMPTQWETRLYKGFQLRFAVRIYAYPEPVGTPLSLASRTCTVAYDLWNEVFRITRVSGGQRTKLIVTKMSQVWNRCVGAPLATIDKPTLGAIPVTLGLVVDAEPDPVLFRVLEDRAGTSPGYGPILSTDLAYGEFTTLFCSPSKSTARYVIGGDSP